ncbi:hypothetical protein Tco_1319695 [Tanacetum coccineum]
MHTTMVPEQVKTQKIQAGVQVSRLEDKDVIFSIGSALDVISLLARHPIRLAPSLNEKSCRSNCKNYPQVFRMTQFQLPSGAPSCFIDDLFDQLTMIQRLFEERLTIVLSPASSTAKRDISRQPLGLDLIIKAFHVDLAKTNHKRIGPTPKTPTEILNFRSCRYYRRFIEGFSKNLLTNDQTQLRRKTPLERGEKQKQAFQTLKHKLIGCGMMQNEKRPTTVMEPKVSVHEIMKKPTTHTLPKGIEYEATDVGRVAHDYDCVIRYHSRKANVVADA